MRRMLYIATVLLVLSVGCKNRENEVVTPPTNLEVAASEISVNHEAQKVEIEVISNEEIDVEIDADWLRVYNMRDIEGGSVVVLSIEANDVAEARNANVVIVAGELRHTVTIAQSGMVATSMEVVISHRNQILASPKWGGEAVSGSIEWGDGTAEEYTEGATHEYTDGESHTATFTMSGTTSLEIVKIGDMESLTIAVD